MNNSRLLYIYTTCNGKNGNCTTWSERCILMGFLRLCGCAIAHACTCAQRGLKPLCLAVRAVVQLCNPLKGEKGRSINTPFLTQALGMSWAKMVKSKKGKMQK